MDYGVDFWLSTIKFIYWNSALSTQSVIVFGYKPLRIVGPNSSSQTYTEQSPYGDGEIVAKPKRDFWKWSFFTLWSQTSSLYIYEQILVQVIQPLIFGSTKAAPANEYKVLAKMINGSLGVSIVVWHEVGWKLGPQPGEDLITERWLDNEYSFKINRLIHRLVAIIVTPQIGRRWECPEVIAEDMSPPRPLSTSL